MHTGPCLTLTRRFATTAARDASQGVKRVGVVGAGQMGTGIALVAAKNAGVEVFLTDKAPSATDKSLSFIDKLLQKDVSKSKLSSFAATSTFSRIRSVSSLADLSDADLVIEAVAESLPLKQAIFKELAERCKPDAVLATNTSAISLTRIASAAGDSAQRVVGMHWFNPVPVMPLVELISSLQTSPSVLERAKGFAEACGKTVTFAKDSPGFISNRVLMPMINEAIMCLEQGVASRDDIDTTMKLGTNVPMGPLTLADFIGLDTCLNIMKVLHEEIGDSKYRPAVLLGRMVDAGWVGKKGGKGFYDY